MKKQYLLFFLGSILVNCTNTQNKKAEKIIPFLTDAIEVYNVNLISEKSLVFAVEGGGKSAYLLDKAGNKKYQWTFDSSLGNDVKMLPNGQLLGMFKTDSAAFKFAGGYGGYIRIINPDNSIAWEYKYSDDNYLSHHEAIMLPNGNVVFLAWEKIGAEEAKNAGVDVDYAIYPEKIMEVDPKHNEIVWEWRSWDHIVQELDSELPNYGIVRENPNKININYALNDKGDIMHANGLVYDSKADLLFVSVNFFSEIWAIDHSTTTEEAASSVGGNYGKGGDLVYRFGNPEAYNNSNGEQLFDHVHHPNLLETGDKKSKNMLVYVNGMKAKKSTVMELKLPSKLELLVDENNEPEVIWSYSDSLLSYGRISGAERLANGNTLICEGDYGFWEVTPDKQIVWKYKDTGRTFWRGYAVEESEVPKQLGVEVK